MLWRYLYIIYLLTPWCRVLLEKLTGLQLIKKFPTFHETRRFITALTSIGHLSLSWASPIQSIYPHPTSWSSILILSTHLRLGLPSGLITRTILGEEYKSFSSSLCNLLHFPVTSSLLGPSLLYVLVVSHILFQARIIWFYCSQITPVWDHGNDLSFARYKAHGLTLW